MKRIEITTKSGIRIAKNVGKQLEDDLIKVYSRVIPINIEIDFEEKSYSEYDKYRNLIATIKKIVPKEDIWTKMYDNLHKIDLSLSAKGFITYIGSKLEYNTNTVYIDTKIAAEENNCHRDTVYEILRQLCSKEVIYKTTKSGVYVVNTAYIFKGDLNTFFMLLNKKREEDPVKYDIDGRIILD